MNDEPVPHDLFDSKLSVSGKLFIRKFASLTQTLMILGIILSALMVAQGIAGYIRFKAEIFNAFPLMKLQHVISPYMVIVYATLFLFQLFYYRKTGKLLLESVSHSDEEKFNASFSFLYRHALVSITGFIISILLYSFDLFVTFKYWP